ncbi:MAG: CpaE family protein [Nocardioides sp.]|uniref:AAA family ATPase n=1 Tax=Nocardioides sp. TaxID=35761 RepID=UPI003EFF31C9
MTVILEPNQVHLALAQATLHGSVAVSSLEELGDHLRDTPHEFAVVIGPSVDLAEATSFAQWVRVQRPELGVIMMRHEVDSSVLSGALRSGMREVVEARDLAGLTTAVQRARSVATAIAQTMEDELQAATTAAVAGVEAASAAAFAAAAQASVAPETPKGTTLTVFSTKGGVGKTVVATNLAVALADLGKKVCLVDLDVNNGDVAIMLQLSPTRNVNDLVAFNGQIDDHAVTSLVTAFSSNLSVLAAPVHIDTPDQATSEDIGKFLDTAATLYDYVVVDTSGVFDDHSLAALDRSDRILLVGTLDIPALKGLKLAVSTLDLLNFPRDTWDLVLNRADGKVGLSIEEYQNTLDLKADIRLESSRDVLTAVNRGEALVRAFPNHPNSKALLSYAGTLAGATVAHDVPEQAPAGRGSRLRLRRS